MKTVYFLLFLVSFTVVRAQSDSVFTDLDLAIKAGSGVKVLILKRHKLTQIPADIFLLTNLTELNLRGNKITSIPTKISDLTHLKYLNLGKNRIDSIPAEIGDLVKLEYLNLEKNPFEFLPKSIGALVDLKYLSIDYTNVKDVSYQIKNCKKLTFFNCRHSYIDVDNTKKIKKWLPDNCVKLFPVTCNCNS